MHRLRGWNLLHEHRCVRVLVPGVPDERAVCGRQRVAGILLLQERICACGGLVHLPDL